MKKIVLSLLFVGMMGFTFAQNPADLAKTDAVKETQEVQTEMVEYPEDVLRDKISSVLAKKGKRFHKLRWFHLRCSCCHHSSS